jgi:heme exporter protein D
MIWQSASEFWAMGGYGVYVWGSMGVSAALLALEVWLARMGRSQALDAVCEAMDAQALDAETSVSEEAYPAETSRAPHCSQGTAP